MRNLLEGRIGKEIEVQCEGAVLKGKVARVEGNVLLLEKDEVICYVNIEHIAAFWEPREKRAQPPGFLSKGK